MPLVAAAVALPLVGLLLTRQSRSLVGLAAALLLAWLNLWWVVPLIGFKSAAIDNALPPFFSVAHSPLIMGVGHLVVIVLVLGALGLFSPRAGSPTELALRSAGRRDFRAAGEYWL
jgi:hypothetical protein